MKKMFLITMIASVLAASSASAQVTTTTKRGMSQPAKGAVIGGVVGAGTGLLIGHKKGKSALIGGAVGAGAGYLYGKHRQKTHPRVVYKRKRRTVIH